MIPFEKSVQQGKINEWIQHVWVKEWQPENSSYLSMARLLNLALLGWNLGSDTS